MMGDGKGFAYLVAKLYWGKKVEALLGEQKYYHKKAPSS